MRSLYSSLQRGLRSPTLRRRLAAYVIDLLVVMVLVMGTLMVSVLAYGAWKYAGDERLVKDMIGSDRTKSFAQLAHAIFFFSYFTICHWYFGRTVGKWITGVEVTHHHHALSFRRSLLRSFGYLLSGSFTFGLGYLPALFRQDERALHDLLADTEVVLTPVSPAASHQDQAA